MKIGLIYPFNKELAADLVRGGGGAGVCWRLLLLSALLLLADLAVTVGGGRGVQRAVVLQLPRITLRVGLINCSI